MASEEIKKIKKELRAAYIQQKLNSQKIASLTLENAVLKKNWEMAQEEISVLLEALFGKDISDVDEVLPEDKESKEKEGKDEAQLEELKEHLPDPEKNEQEDEKLEEERPEQQEKEEDTSLKEEEKIEEEGEELQKQENSDIKQKNQEPSESSFSSCHFLKDPLIALNKETTQEVKEKMSSDKQPLLLFSVEMPKEDQKLRGSKEKKRKLRPSTNEIDDPIDTSKEEKVNKKEAHNKKLRAEETD